jgi:AraC family transcriptional regulator of adaptative response / DNA-3-methyladenine glycosylase II
VHRALKLIEEGALNRDNLATLAARLGIGERYLRKLFERELGVSPQAVAINQRLLFAKKLLAETQLPLTDVAFAAGFGSVRRFNSAVREHFRLTPGEMRRRKSLASVPGGLTIELQYRPPYDWEGVLAYFQRHAVEGIEVVDSSSYRRKLAGSDGEGELIMRPAPGKNALRMELTQTRPEQLMPLVARVRRMFDLDANPAMIHEVLGRDPQLSQLLARWPGIRAPGCWSVYESSIRAIVGQQVSTVAARGICARLAGACGAQDSPLAFPSPEALAALDDSHFPMPGSRRETLRALARACLENERELDLEALGQLRGVGPWTVAMVGMRGAGDPDAFPLTDLGVVKAWEALAGDRDLKTHMPHWRPWRAYAANLLWRSLSQ